MAKGIYVGVSETEKLTTFSDCPFPNFTTNTATDKYGTWTVSCSSQRNSTTYAAYNAFDTDTGTLWGSGKLTTNFAYVQLDFPQGVSIKPTTVMMTYASCGTGSCVQGYNPDTGEWVTIGNTSQLSTSDKVERFEYSGTVYFTAIRAYANAYSGSYAYVSNLKITAGTIKNVGQYTIAHKVTKAYVGAAEESLVVNGDFSNGLNGWILYDSNNYLSASTSEGILTLTMTSRSNNTWQTMISEKSFYFGNVGDLLYVSFEYSYNVDSVAADSYDDKCMIYIDNGSYDAFVSITNTSQAKTRYSNIFTSKDTNLHSFRFGMVGSANQYITISGIKLYNLTALYGAGNEPTQEWCDNNLEALKNLYKSKNGVARKVKKGYIGVGGVARPFFSAERKLEYYGTAESLTLSKIAFNGTSVGNYAIFAGGYDGNNVTATADAYGKNLAKSTPTSLSTARMSLASAKTNNYALFAGGQNNSSTYYKIVDAYDASLARSTPTALIIAVTLASGASAGNYAIFAGGYDGSERANVNAYDENLTRTNPTALSLAVRSLAGTNVGEYAIFAGGYTTVGKANAAAYNSSLVKTVLANLSVGRGYLAAASVGDYALFAGGNNTSGVYRNEVDSYNSSLVKTTPTELSVARQELSGASVDGYAIFAGGSDGSVKTTVDAYDVLLARSTPAFLSLARRALVGASVGDYAIFAGGQNASSTRYKMVDVYQTV